MTPIFHSWATTSARQGFGKRLLSAGGGAHTLKDSTYTEHLDYCNDRNWENNKFEFTVRINNDTLIQQGVEKIEAKQGLTGMNIEKA